jgi:hypothetical protein
VRCRPCAARPIAAASSLLSAGAGSGERGPDRVDVDPDAGVAIEAVPLTPPLGELLRPRSAHGATTVAPRRLVGASVAVGGATVVAVALALPWVRSGSVRRSGYELADTLTALALTEGVADVLVVAVYFVPALAALGLLALVLRRPGPALLPAAVAVAVGLVAAVATWRGPLPGEVGPRVAVSGVVLWAVGAVTALVRSPSPATGGSTRVEQEDGG